MGRLQRALHITAGTSAGIEEAAVTEFPEGNFIITPSLALGIRAKGAATVGSFLPAKAEPAQIFDHRVG